MATNSYGWAAPANTGGMGGGVATQPYNMGMTNPYQPSSVGTDFLADWMERFGPKSKYGDYSKTPNRDIVEFYNENIATPYFNAAMADRTQGFNEWQAGANMDEQRYVNRAQLDLARLGNAREDLALGYGQANNQRDFGEAQRQFDRQFGLDQELGRGALAATNYGNETTRMVDQERNRIANYEAQTGRIDVEGRQRLDQYSNETARLGVENQYRLGNFSNDTARMDVQNQFTLGNRSLDQQRYETDTRAAVDRDRMAADAVNQRYATFGRASAPNVRQMRSW